LRKTKPVQIAVILAAPTRNLAQVVERLAKTVTVLLPLSLRNQGASKRVKPPSPTGQNLTSESNLSSNGPSWKWTMRMKTT